MDSEWVVPPPARKDLIGKRVANIAETYPHHLSIEFADGTVLGVTALPFKDGTLDVAWIPSFAED